MQQKPDTGESTLKQIDTAGGSRLRHYHGWAAWGVKGFAALIPLYSIFFMLNIMGYYFNKTFFIDAYLAIFLCFILIMVFLVFPATKKSPHNRLPWYDIVLIVATLATTIYRANISWNVNWGFKAGATILDQVMFVFLLITMFEAVRRTTGLIVLSIIVLFVIYIFTAHYLPGLWGSSAYSWKDFTGYMYVFNEGIFGMVLRIAGTIIILFVTFGAFMFTSGMSKVIMDLALAVAGRYRGGPAKVAIVASALMGMLSGSPTANAGTMGVISIPLMRKLGYNPNFAGAVEAVASTGGVLMPPIMGSVAFLMAEMTGVGYGAVCVAAALPAILYYLCLYFQLDFEAAKMGLVGLSRAQLPSLKRTIMEGGYLFLPVIILIILLATGMDILYVVTYSMASVIIVSLFRKDTRMGFKKIFDSLSSGTEGVLTVVPVMAAVGIIVGALSLTGLSVNLGSLIRVLAGNNLWLLAILVWVFLYIAGTGVGQIATYLVMVVLVGPAFVQMGVSVLTVHMFIFISGMSMFVTPPNCPVVFIASSISGGGIWRTGFAAMKLGIVAFLLPFILLYKPTLMLTGTPLEIIVGFVSACLSALFLAAGVEGFLLRNASIWQRLLFLIGGVGLLVPGWQIEVIALLVLLVAVLPHFITWRAEKRMVKF